MNLIQNRLPPYGGRSTASALPPFTGGGGHLFNSLSSAITDHNRYRKMTSSSATLAGGAELGRAIRDRRKALRLSQSELAKMALVGRRFISEIENGKETVALRETFKVINALGIQMSVSTVKDAL